MDIEQTRNALQRTWSAAKKLAEQSVTEWFNRAGIS
jgi:hypothetical protein